MKKEVTLFARGVVYLVGIAALVVCLVFVPEMVREEGVGKPFNLYWVIAFFTGVYALATPFFIALYQTLKLLNSIDRGKAFTPTSTQALRSIKMCAIVFSVMVIVFFGVGVSILRSTNPGEDAPPFMMLGFILSFSGFIIAVFVAVLQKLLSEAVAMKSENDLIV